MLRIAYNGKTGKWRRENRFSNEISAENLPPIPAEKWAAQDFTIFNIGNKIWLSAPNGNFEFGSEGEAVAFYIKNYQDEGNLSAA